MSAEVPPATLPGTPKVINPLRCLHRCTYSVLGLVSSQLGFLWLQSFPIGEEKLISMAKQVFETSSGQKDASVLADDFRFEFPIVSLSKEVCSCSPHSWHSPCGDTLPHQGVVYAASGLTGQNATD